MKKFRKKPVIVTAVQYNGSNVDEIRAFVGKELVKETVSEADESTGRDITGVSILIPTLEGDIRALPGDWIIRGVQGECYPCKPDVFAATYEEADGADQPDFRP